MRPARSGSEVGEAHLHLEAHRLPALHPGEEEEGALHLGRGEDEGEPRRGRVGDGEGEPLGAAVLGGVLHGEEEGEASLLLGHPEKPPPWKLSPSGSFPSRVKL